MAVISDLPNLYDPIVYLQPRRIVESAWLGHIPFAMWLVHTHRPRVSVELGVASGASFCAMVQAAQVLNHGGRFFGIDTWLGDEHAGSHSDHVYHELSAYHRQHLAEKSDLLRSCFDDAVSAFENATIDLLHIDGYHTYEAVKNDFDRWLPKMSSRGIVLFHDTVERNRDFGVWRYWAEIKRMYPSFNFEHSHGLGVCYVGTDEPPKWVDALARLDDAEDGEKVRTHFRAAGAAIQDRLAIGALTRQLTVARMKQEIQNERIRSLRARLERVSNAGSAESARLEHHAFDAEGHPNWLPR